MTTRPSRFLAAMACGLLCSSSCATDVLEPTACSKVPAFMIGGHNAYLGGHRNAYHPACTTKEDLVSMIHDVTGPAPEAVVVVIGPSNRMEPYELQNLKNHVLTAPSSKVIPCIIRSDVTQVTEYMSQYQGQRHRPQVVDHTAVEDHLTSSLLSDGKTDVVVTSLPPHTVPQHVDTFMSQLHDHLKSQAKEGRYLLVLVPEHDYDQPIHRRRLNYPLPAHQRHLQSSSNDTDESGWPYQPRYLYATPNLVAGLLTGLFFAATVWVGAAAMFSLQGPSKWIHEKIPEGKEF